MLAKHYAEAISKLSGDDVTSKLVSVLKKKGHIDLLPAILAEYEKLQVEVSKKENVRVRVAQRADVAKYKDSISSYAEQLSFNAETVEVVEDPSIVGGFIIEKGEYEVDRSHRKNLVALYRRLMSINIQHG